MHYTIIFCFVLLLLCRLRDIIKVNLMNANCCKKHTWATLRNTKGAIYIVNYNAELHFTNLERGMGQETPRETARIRKVWKWGCAESAVNKTLRGTLFRFCERKANSFKK